MPLHYKNLSLTWLGHAGFNIKTHDGTTLVIDPFQIISEEKADFVFITHPHYDHCSIEDIKKILQSHTIVVCTTDVQSKLGKIGSNVKTIVVEPGKNYEVAGLPIKTVPAYNKTKQFHPKENHWVGYIFIIDGTRVYHAGDSDLVPEISTVQSDIALLPVGGTYTMNAEEAAIAAQNIQPACAIPMHWGSIVGSIKDAEEFVRICTINNVHAQILKRE